LHLFNVRRIHFVKEVFFRKVEKMKESLSLVESVYCNNGKTFEEILKRSIENYAKNIYSLPRQTTKNLVKCD